VNEEGGDVAYTGVLISP